MSLQAVAARSNRSMQPSIVFSPHRLVEQGHDRVFAFVPCTRPYQQHAAAAIAFDERPSIATNEEVVQHGMVHGHRGPRAAVAEGGFLPLCFKRQVQRGKPGLRWQRRWFCNEICGSCQCLSITARATHVLICKCGLATPNGVRNGGLAQLCGTRGFVVSWAAQHYLATGEGGASKSAGSS